MTILKTMIRAIVPARIRPTLRRFWDRAKFRGDQFECPVCHSRLKSFLPSQWEKHAHCPICNSKTPHRFASYYFKTHPETFRTSGQLVHIAPEPELQKQLRQCAAIARMSYRSGSISGIGESYLDLLHLPFESDSVDLIYCCHVLNSLQADREAMAEVFRVLSPDGLALLQVPAYYQGSSTIETSNRDERLSIFHNEGIYRCYTPDDYIHRLRQAGFVVECFCAKDLPPEIVRRHGLNLEVLHVCRKRNGMRRT